MAALCETGVELSGCVCIVWIQVAVAAMCETGVELSGCGCNA